MGLGVLTQRRPVEFKVYENVIELGWTLGLLAGCVPWGVRREDGLVIFAKPTEEAPGIGDPYSKYDDNLNNRRKTMFESELATMITFGDVSGAIQKVNANLDAYVQQKLLEDHDRTMVALDTGLRRALYSDKGFFGRLGGKNDAPASPADLVWEGLKALHGTSIATVLGIHYAFVKVFETLGVDPIRSIMAVFWGARLRPASLLGGTRSRESRFTQGHEDPQTPTNIGGITADGDTPVATTSQTHARAVNTWVPDRANPTEFYLDSIEQDLPFVAGPSGSTADLFRCAMLMANLSAEEATQYALACVAYLEVGGNHSFHEIMTLASLAGVPYVKGEYEPSLPEAFKSTAKYQNLRTKYLDVWAGIITKKFTQNAKAKAV